MNGTMLGLLLCGIVGFVYGTLQKVYIKGTVITHLLGVAVCLGVIVYNFPEDGLVNSVISGTLPKIVLGALIIFSLNAFWLAGIALRAFITKKPEENHIFDN